MRQHKQWLLLGCLQSITAAADAPRPRGVGPEFAKYYKSSDTFTCISNPSIKLPVSKLNDDYCDCPDGSDEPGTSACSFISSLSPPSPGVENQTLALPGFYCENKGHRPAYIPFTYINDGVCDHELCCDGSDEWAGVGGVTCPDRCKEIGKEWRAKDDARKKAKSQAVKKRKELVTQAVIAKKKLEDDLAIHEGQVQAAERKVKDLEVELQEVERKEQGKIAKGKPGAGKIGLLVGLAKARVEELREALLSVRRQRDAASEKIKKLEQILSTFKEEYNPNFNDEGVKRAVRSWEEYAAGKDGEATNAADKDKDLEEIMKSDGQDSGINWEEWESGGDQEGSDVDILYNIHAYLPASVHDWLNAKKKIIRGFLVENGILAGSDSSDDDKPTASKQVIDARKALSTARTSLTDLQTRLTNIRSDLERDYGPDAIFLSLKGSCIETDSGEYTYRLCWMDRTSQKQKKGGSETSMGTFTRFETLSADQLDIDDDHDHDHDHAQNGEESGRAESTRLGLRFENGQHCWNGPNRSTLVVLRCADKDVILKVVEEEKCIYRMEVGSPAGCEGDRAKAGDDGSKRDEL